MYLALSISVLARMVHLAHLLPTDSLEGKGWVLLLVVISFPASFLLLFVEQFFLMCTQCPMNWIEDQPAWISVVIINGSVAAVGYLQWFIVVPFVVRRLRPYGMALIVCLERLYIRKRRVRRDER